MTQKWHNCAFVSMKPLLKSPTHDPYIYEPGIDCPLAEVSDSGALTFYHQD